MSQEIRDTGDLLRNNMLLIYVVLYWSSKTLREEGRRINGVVIEYGLCFNDADIFVRLCCGSSINKLMQVAARYIICATPVQELPSPMRHPYVSHSSFRHKSWTSAKESCIVAPMI